jgi:hypothetical protein
VIAEECDGSAIERATRSLASAGKGIVMSKGALGFFMAVGALCMLPSLVACGAPVDEPAVRGSVESPMAKPHGDEVRVEVGEAKLTLYPERALLTHCKADAECNDGNACTRDACDSTTHRCEWTLIDADGDGYAPSSLGACGSDCDDGNALVHPAQTGWFGAPYATPSGAMSFDYDCDGKESRQFDDFGYCIGAATKEDSVCSCVAGWTDVVPACGGTGEFSDAGSCGSTKVISKLQGCR